MTEAIPTSWFKARALEIYDRTIPEQELRTIDVTVELFRELRNMIKEQELINVQINAEPGGGKSVVGIMLYLHISKLLRREPHIRFILRNQIAANRFMMKFPIHTKHHCILVDEYSELSETGLGASMEQKLSHTFSDLFREFYVHRISCSPKDIQDKNSNIFLEILTPDKRRSITRALVYYKMFYKGIEHLQLLGYADFNVKGTLAHPIYKQYSEQKTRNLKLIVQYKVKDDRDLEMPEIILKVIEDMQILAKHGITDKETIKAKLASHENQMDTFLTILHRADLIDKIHSALTAIHRYHILSRKVLKLKEELNRHKETARIANNPEREPAERAKAHMKLTRTMETRVTESDIDEMETIRDQLYSSYQETCAYWQKMADLKKQIDAWVEQ